MKLKYLAFRPNVRSKIILIKRTKKAFLRKKKWPLICLKCKPAWNKLLDFQLDGLFCFLNDSKEICFWVFSAVRVQDNLVVQVSQVKRKSIKTDMHFRDCKQENNFFVRELQNS